MKILVFAVLLTLAGGLGVVAGSLQTATGQNADTLLPGQRMVQAVQFPLDIKVKFDPLYPTGRIKDISGRAEVKRTKTIEVEVEIDAPPPSELKPDYKGYVVWALATSGKFTRLGTIERKGTLKVTTNLRAFGIVVTAEPDVNAATPGDPVLESGMPDARKRYYPIRRVVYTPAVK